MNLVQLSKMERFKCMMNLIIARQEGVLSLFAIIVEVLLLPLSLVASENYDILLFSLLFLYSESINSIVTSIYNDLNCFISLGYRRKEIYDNIFKIFLGISGVASILVVLFQYSLNSGKEGIVFLGIIFSKLNVFSSVIIFLLSFIFFMGISVLANSFITDTFWDMRYCPLVFIVLWILIKKIYSFKPFISQLSIALFIASVVFIYFSYKYGLKVFKNKDI